MSDAEAILREKLEFLQRERETVSDPEQRFTLDKRIEELRKRLGENLATAPQVLVANLPVSGPVFVGRDDELARLDAAFADDGVHVVAIVAWGGVGKTALVNRWLDRLAGDGYRGVRRVLGYSFYSQGVDEKRLASADVFVDWALRTLGDPDPSAGSPRDRGLRLARLVQSAPTLLVLDGVEPLQHPPDSALAGRLKDPALAALLKSLALGCGGGLCVVSTRETIDDLAPFPRTTERIDLERLTDDDGVELLGHLGVAGSQRDLTEAVRVYGGHALALTLLGNYLKRAHGGDVRKRDRVELKEADARQGEHAWHVMGSYERWLGDGPELAILRLLGFFDRPAPAGAIAALRGEPVIRGLNDLLFLPKKRWWSRKREPVSEESWSLALTTLRENGLLAPAGGDALDAHPLIRSYFAEQLATGRPEAWREGQSRLYEYYKDTADERPDTLDALMPLYAAVVHGCRAGRPQEAMDEVFIPRILRGNEHFSSSQLGAFGAELTALAGFFERPLDRPSAGLSTHWQAFVLAQAGFCLRALGRLPEAVQPMRAGLDLLKAQENWEHAAGSAGNFSELSLTLGDVSEAVVSAEESVVLADRSDDAFLRMLMRTTLADALHQAGNWDESAASFREAETLQAEWQPEYPRLYSFQGYRYCDLLLSPPGPRAWSGLDVLAEDDAEALRQACGDVLERAKLLFEWRLPSDSILGIALGHLSLGRARFGLGLSDDKRRTSEFAAASEHLNQAVDGLRRAGTEDHLPRGLLARAAYRRVANDDGARADLDEAAEIAERGGMKLYLADVHLEWTRFHLAGGRVEEARRSLAVASAIVEEVGYGRRRPEVAFLEGLVG